MSAAEHNLEALRKLAADCYRNTDDDERRRRWSQYHNALQAMYERGTLIAAAPDLHRHVTEQGAEIVRLRSLLGRYAVHVGEEEGSDCLRFVWSSSPISDDEAQEISGLRPGNAARAVKP